MAVRRERVILDLEGNFERNAIKDAAAVEFLKKELDGLSGKAVRAHKPLQDTQRDLDGVGRSARRNGAEIDNLSGRLNVLRDGLLVFGPALSPLTAAGVGGLAGFANQLGMAAAGAGVAVLAFHGMGDSLKALNEARLDPTAENLEKVNEELAKLSPAGQDFARTLSGLMPGIEHLQASAQSGLFPGLTDALTTIRSRGPEVNTIVAELSSAMGELAKEGAEALASPKWDTWFQTFETSAKPTLLDLGHALGNVTKAAADLWVAFAPLNQDFGRGLVDATASLEKWAAGLSSTTGFQSFVQYVEKSGPEVLHTLGSIANMFIQIGTAMAPLGGPALHLLSALADAVANIAGSDLGTPIFAALGAMALFNRSLQLGEKLQMATFGGPALARIKGMGSGLRMLGADLSTVHTRLQWTATDTEAIAAANTRLRSSYATFGKTAAGLGAVAVASTGVADKVGLTNTATLALAGSMAGPLGAGVGAAVGGFLDMKHASDQLNASINTTADTLPQAQAKLAQLKAELAGFDTKTSTGGFFSSGYWRDWGHSLNSVFSGDLASKLSFGIFGDTGQEKAKTAIGATTRQITAMQAAQASANYQTDVATAATNRYNNSLQDLQNRLANRSALGAYLQSLIDTRNAIRENGKAFNANGTLIDKSNAKMVASFNQLTSLASAMQSRLGELSGQKQLHAMNQMKAQFVQLARQMGMGRQTAKLLADQLLNLNQLNVKPKIDADTSKALAAIQKIKSELAHIPRSISTRYYVTQTNAFNKPRNMPGNPDGSADGSTVPKDGGSYADRFPYMLAPGEEVISNRFGQADRARPLLKAINAGMLADGGTVFPWQGLASGGTARRSRLSESAAAGGPIAVLKVSSDPVLELKELLS